MNSDSQVLPEPMGGQSELLDVLLSGIGDGVIVTDAEGRVTCLSRAAERITGWPAQEARGAPFEQVFRTVDEHTGLAVEPPLAAASGTAEGAAVTTHAVLISRDGLRIPIDARRTPMRAATDGPAGAVVIFRDVSERRRGERAGASLAALIESSHDAIISKTLDGIVTSWNPAAARLFGYTPEEIIGKPIATIIPPELRAEEAQILARLRRGERMDHYETVRLAKDGRRLEISLSVSPIKDESGTIVGSSKIARDITERRRIERELREAERRKDILATTLQAERRFRALMDCAADAMVVVDGSGRIVQVNARTETLLGYRRQELIGEPIELLIPERYRDAHRVSCDTYVHAPVLRPVGTSHELCARRRDGTEIPVEVSLGPIATSEGLQIASTIRDISERRRALAELREARVSAEKADRAKSTFLATASHDLRQPLQTLSLLNATLRRMVKDPDPADALSQQEAAIGVMSRLLNALLDISKLECGAVKPVPTNWQVVTLFDQLRSEFAQVAADKGLQLEVESAAAWVRSDLSLAGQVLRNLMSNAIRYTQRGSVRLRARAQDGAVRIEVSDTGIGMAPEELGHIYEEFYQIGVPTHATREGYGLGLSIVRRIVRLLGVGLEVRSEVGQGSTFVLTLPAGSADRPASHSGVRPAAGRGGRCAHRVLVVEDEPAVLNATRMLLTAEGYGVATATSVAQAVERVRESRDLELLITDYHLADGETGRQVITSVREIRGADLKAVLITGDTSTAARGVEGHENVHFLSKPVHPDELLGLLEELVTH